MGQDLNVSDERVLIPGAEAPARRRTVDSHGVELAVYEWGSADHPPLALVHGGFDFARTFDVFAPLLARAGWRVVAWDQRGHGDSQHAAMYSWATDVRDALAVLDTVTREPLPVVGHSKGGSLMLDLASSLPERVSRLVNLDGLPSRRNWPDVPDHVRTKLLSGDLATWLDVRRSTVDAIRKPGTLEELAARRGRMNQRLSTDWLRYLVTVGGRHDADGWRWKIDPTMRMGGFGPWRPEWAMERLSLVGVPVMALLGLEPEVMGWGTLAEDVEPYLAPGGVVEELDGVGHFVHIEQPERVAAKVLEFVGEPGVRTDRLGSDRPQPTVMLRHNRVNLGLHRLRSADAASPGQEAQRPLLLVHGLGEESPRSVPEHVAGWPGPIWALDLTGHGSSTVPAGGGYFAELLMGDVDMALAHLGPSTVYGRGLGAYLALLIAGARSDLVRGAILDDGPGLYGGGDSPATSYISTQPFDQTHAPPDPYALLELSRDPRPGDYAATFARQAATLSGLDVALAVVGAVRPSWLVAVAKEPGVEELTRAAALRLFASS